MSFTPMTDTAETFVNLHNVETLRELVDVLTGEAYAEVDGNLIDAQAVRFAALDAMGIDGVDSSTGFVIGDGDHSEGFDLMSTAYGEIFQLGDDYAIESGEHQIILAGW